MWFGCPTRKGWRETWGEWWDWVAYNSIACEWVSECSMWKWEKKGFTWHLKNWNGYWPFVFASTLFSLEQTNMGQILDNVLSLSLCPNTFFPIQYWHACNLDNTSLNFPTLTSHSMWLTHHPFLHFSTFISQNSTPSFHIITTFFVLSINHHIPHAPISFHLSLFFLIHRIRR